MQKQESPQRRRGTEKTTEPEILSSGFHRSFFRHSPCLCVSVASIPLSKPSKHKSRLQLKHSRRIDVSERRNRIRGRADAADKLSKGRRRRRSIAVSSDTASQHVRVIKDIEAFDAQNNVTSLVLEQALLDKEGNIRSRR